MSLVALFDNIFGLRKVKRITAGNNATTIRDASETLSLRARINGCLPSMQVGLVPVPTGCAIGETSTGLFSLRLRWFENGRFLLRFFLTNKWIHPELFDILLEISLQLVDVRVLLDSGHLRDVRIVEVADVVLLNLELLELPLYL